MIKQLKVFCFSVYCVIWASYPVQSLACTTSPVFSFSQAVYFSDYGHARSLLPSIKTHRGEVFAQFLAHVLDWKMAFDQDQRSKQIQALKRIDDLLKTQVQINELSPSLEGELLLGEMMIHCARMNLLIGQVFKAVNLAKTGNDYIESVLSQAPNNIRALFISGIYQYYVGSDEAVFGWFKKLYSLQGDKNKGRLLIELAVKKSPDYAFEALRTLMMELNWDRVDTCQFLDAFNGLQTEAPLIEIEPKILNIQLNLFCYQAGLALKKIKILPAEKLDKAQQQWVLEAQIYALGQAGKKSQLLALAKEFKANLKPDNIVFIQLALAKLADSQGQREDAKNLYRKVIQSKTRKKYKHLAKKYLALAYSGKTSTQEKPQQAISLACG